MRPRHDSGEDSYSAGGARGETLLTLLNRGVEAASSRRIPRSTETGARTGQYEVIAELRVEQAGQRCELNGCEVDALKLVSSHKWNCAKRKRKARSSERKILVRFSRIPVVGLSLGKKKWLVKDIRIYVEWYATKGGFGPAKGQGLV